MRTFLQVLSEKERTQVHARSLDLLSRVGVKVETARGREILANAGAQVNPQTHIVRFPPQLVETALEQTPILPRWAPSGIFLAHEHWPVCTAGRWRCTVRV
jgi:trimethylamine:corrinoid methyltransferase-like protein